MQDSTLFEQVYPGHAPACVAALPEATIVCAQELMMLPPPDHVREFADRSADDPVQLALGLRCVGLRGVRSG